LNTSARLLGRCVGIARWLTARAQVVHGHCRFFYLDKVAQSALQRYGRVARGPARHP
jgi:hypothetical protein